MIARFFIDRPIFAWVIAIVIMLAGVAAMETLPIAQFPDVAPPQVSISATYPGASAETIENAVTQVIEPQLTGLDGLLYFTSSSTSTGSMSIQATFQQGTNPDVAQVQVQNKVQQALSRLPSQVQLQGVSVTKAQSDFLMIVGLYDATDHASYGDVSDYLVSNFQDTLSRVDGVGSVQTFGSQYAMRIWLDPAKLQAYSLMPADVATAIAAQNAQISAGKIGDLPSPGTQQLTATVTAQSELRTTDQFRAIVVKYDSAGAAVHVGDIARVELGNESYSQVVRVNSHAGSGIAIMLAPGANALSTAERVRTTVERLSQNLPKGYTVVYPKDSTPFIRLSIEEVVITLIEAIALVVVVMFVFLQSWRATLIPAIAVPVVLLGTFGVLHVLGYSINTLTMFGLVLSIGLLVDDAIVVVENIERIMREQGSSPRQAAIQSMEEITSALVGIATVLSVVFVPMAFFSGSTGVIYRQFSITIVSSMILSVVVALTLTPTLCATILQPVHVAHEHGFFGWFNRNFDRFTRRYAAGVARVLRRPAIFLSLYAGIVVVLGLLFMHLPGGYLPDEDQGEIMVQYTLPIGATSVRTEAVGRQIVKYFQDHEADNIDSIFTVAGFNFSGNGQNLGLAFVPLKDWSKRPGYRNRADQIALRATIALQSIRDAQIFSLNPPAIQGLGQAGGFEFRLLADAGTTRAQLLAARNQLLGAAAGDAKLAAVRPGDVQDAPQLKVEVDRAKANSLGLSISDVNSVLSAAWGGYYVNDFIDRSRVKRVYIQGDSQFRSAPKDLGEWYVRGSNGKMTPFSAFATTHWQYGPESLPRFNGTASYLLQGSGAPGVSSGTAMDEMLKLQKALPPGTVAAWSGESYQERIASGQAYMLYGVSILGVFLCLAALYESWSVPLSVLLVVPLGMVGAVTAVTLRGLNNDIYFQVALLTTIGLSAKNAILIVEFAEAAHHRGRGLVEAALEAARLRWRPILMTSLAFTAGVLPLAVATGAGANGRIAIGTGVIGGVITATALAVILVPMFFVLVRKLFPGRAMVHQGRAGE